MRLVSQGKENKDSIALGVNTIGNAVRSTLGPKGKLVTLEGGKGEFYSTKDGYTVAWHVQHEDPVANSSISILRESATRTNQEAGDGTTTATLLAQELYNHGSEALKTVTNETEFFKGMQWAKDKVIENLKSQAIPCRHDSDKIAFVARISANNDTEIGDLIASAMKDAGEDGVITVETSPTSETYFKKEEGFEFDSGWLSPAFCNNPRKQLAELTNCYVLLVDGELSKFGQLKELLNLYLASSAGAPLLVIANDIIGDVLTGFAVNHQQGKLNCCAVKSAGNKVTHKRWLDDVAVMTGATVISQDDGKTLQNFTLDWLGRCEKAIVSQTNTLLINGNGKFIEKHVDELKGQLETADQPNMVALLKNRIARFSGGIGVIYVGSLTNVGQREKKDRVDDALNATKAAVEEGYVVGGGKALWNALKMIPTELRDKDFIAGVNTVTMSICQPVLQLTGGKTIEEMVANKVDLLDCGEHEGYNAYTDKVENLIDAGVIDPVKVVRCALENAVEVSIILLRTDFSLVHDAQTIAKAE